MTEQYDVVIAGGGIAGILIAVKMHEKYPDAQIVILERESLPGGRARSSSVNDERWSYGLNRISLTLFEYWNQLLKQNPEGEDLPSFATSRIEQIGILAGGKLTSVAAHAAFGIEGAKAIAGSAAVRDWGAVDALVNIKDDAKKLNQPLSAAWSGGRKSPSAVVLEHLASLWGIADVWKTSPGSLLEKARMHQQDFFGGHWENALLHLLANPAWQSKISLITNCRIIGAKYREKTWAITTDNGLFQGRCLAVAQSPWNALNWLPVDESPPSILSITSKTKPTSSVVLSIIMTEKVDLPEIIIVPAEGVQILIGPSDEICFQSTIDYELTLQAPDVVKAVKRLRRAHKKLLQAFPELKTLGDHIVLIPVSWAQPTAWGDRRWINKLSQHDFNSRHLVFCGDAYGDSMDGDKNIIESINSAYERIEL